MSYWKLMCYSYSSRYYLSYLISQNIQVLWQSHFEVSCCILCYLKGASENGLSPLLLYLWLVLWLVLHLAIAPQLRVILLLSTIRNRLWLLILVLSLRTVLMFLRCQEFATPKELTINVHSQCTLTIFISFKICWC